MTTMNLRPPALGRLRLASVEDAPIIIGMVNESMSKTFRVHGTSQIVYLIENSVISIVQLDLEDELVGFISARDYPLVPAVHPRAWEEYIWAKYKSVELNARNTLFLHMMCWDTTVYKREVVDSMLKSLLMHDPYLQYIAMVKSLIQFPLLMPGVARAEASFKRVGVIEKGMSGDQLPSLWIADRKEISPRLRIRRAVEEDNDDVVPIIEAHSKILREMYGEFYVSELISRHPESERILLVCEHKEVAVGIMCLNTLVNYEALEESFELSPFAGLRKLDQAPLKRSKDLDSSASLAVSMTNDEFSSVQGATLIAESLARARENKARVTWVFNEDEFKDFRETPLPPGHAFPHTTPAHLHILHLMEDDQDELEFDIVNIDTDLLRVPKLLTFDPLATSPTENMQKNLDGSCKGEGSADEKKKEKPKVTTSTIPPEPTRYSGSPNAFLLELFAMSQDYDERYGFDMLEAAYELFPDRDYCIVCLPSNHASFPLLEHFTLVTALSTGMRFINDTLYVAHVNSVRGDLTVRSGEAYDIPAMYDICERSPRAQGLIDLFESSIESSFIECFVMLSQNQPVGMIVLGPLDDGPSIRTQYGLEPEPRRPGTDGMVLAGIVAPGLEPHNRWFMRELLRHSKYSSLFWLCRLFAKGESSPNRHLTSVAGHMTPVHPRRAVPNISGNKDLDKIFKDVSTPFALWVLERPLTSLPKVYVNSGIVVVGASRTGLAFLETLLLGPTSQYLTFSNVTLVSEHGLPTLTDCLRAAATCVPRDGRYTDRYLKSVPFYFYIDIMTAVMVGIDRKKKCIYLKGGELKFYDELVLTCGQQFQHPDYLHGPLQLVKEVEQGKPCDRVLMDDPNYQPDKVPDPAEMPENVMLINSLYEANICLKKFLRMISEAKETRACLSTENQVIVYGDCIEAYSCIAALLELGLSGDMISFVEPFPPDDPKKLRVNCFNDETIDERVQKNIEGFGIEVYRKYYLTGWQIEGTSRVESINLMSQFQAIRLPCFALFYYGLKAINVSAFRAINKCGLVYDGGLVVGASFETNDPHVYGAGTCVKYSRRLFAKPQAHRHYYSEDVGEALAKLFLRKLDPFVMAGPEETDLMPRYSSTLLRGSYGSITSSSTRLSVVATKMPVKWQPVMKFESPIVRSATFPGPVYYMKLRKPGPEIPMEVQKSLPRQGHTLITDKNNNYFCLQLNVLHCVNAVTCLSEKPFSTEILSQLYGKHEAFFNRLLTRFEMDLIDDLYAFFTQPWMSAIYQETFYELLGDIYEQDVGTVYDLVKSRFNLFDDSSNLNLTACFKRENSCLDVSTCGYGPKEAHNLGTFRSVIDNFVIRKSSDVLIKDKPTDIPSVCGQTQSVRSQTIGFWRTIGGERIVNAHLARYLHRTSIMNSHYALPDPDVT